MARKRSRKSRRPVEAAGRRPSGTRSAARWLPPLAIVLALAAAATLVVRLGPSSSPSPPAPEPQPDASATAVPAGSAPFLDVTAQVGPDFVHVNSARGEYRLWEIMGGGAGFLDFDGDGDLDLYLVQSDDAGGEGSRLYRNDDGTFVDATSSANAGVPGIGMGCAAADWDRDGDPDLYVTRVGEDVALRNDGGRFVDVTATAGLGTPGYSSSAAFLDFDRDGFPDLYVTRYVSGHEGRCQTATGTREYCNPTALDPTADVLYRNRGDGTFEDVSAPAGIAAERGYGLALLATDFDDDGWVDVYVANDQSPAFLWHNRGDGTFEETALLAGCAFNGDGEAIAGMGTAANDLDGDGDLDLFVTNIREESNLFLQNDGGMFTDAGWAWGALEWMQPHTGFGTAMFDADRDGRLDLFIANGSVIALPSPEDPARPYAQSDQYLSRDADGRFVDRSKNFPPGVLAPAVSRAVAPGDFDNDGDLDLLVGRNGEAPQLLRNEADAGHWLGIVPVEGESAVPVLNARVIVEAGGRRFTGEVRPQQSYLASGDPRVHVGLGDLSGTDRIVVRWPDGRRESWPGGEVNRYVTLRRGEGSPE